MIKPLSASRVRHGAWIFIAVLLIESAWILTVPPYRAIDEFDHVYRADYVAHGHWERPTTPVDNGRGGALTVRASIVDTAGPVCASYKYTGPDNCRSITASGGFATVASGAFAYDATYYWLVGTPALAASDGVTALYVMRATSALLCALVLTFACLCLRTVHDRLPVLGLLIGCTPTVAYSFSIVGPNGLEMAAGAGAWAGLLALTQPRARLSWSGPMLVGTAICCSALAVLRPLGPLWLFLIAAVVVLARGWAPWVAIARRSPLLLTGSVILVAISASVTARAVLAVQVGTFRGPSMDSGESGWSIALTQLPVWLFQSVAAFPLRNESAPLIVYALQIGVLLTWLVMGLLAKAEPRLRSALALTLVTGLGGPAVLAAATLGPLAITWQGRYSLPFTIGGAMLAGIILASSTTRVPAPLGIVVAGLGGSCLVMAQLISLDHVYATELTNPAVGASGWPFAPPWSITALTASAWIAFALFLREGSTRRTGVKSLADRPDL